MGLECGDHLYFIREMSRTFELNTYKYDLLVKDKTDKAL
jgi:hypothetical protein